MGRNKRKELMNTVPDKVIRRSDAIQYWLQQRDYPKPGTPKYKEELSLMDKIVINMIYKAMDGNAPAGNWIMENGFGKNSEGMDVSSGESTVGAMFNIPTTVSEYNRRQVDLEDSIEEIENQEKDE